MQGMTNAEATKVIVRNALTTDEGAALLLARLSYNTEHMEKWGKLPETTTQSKGHMDAASTTNGEAGDDTDSAASGSTLQPLPESRTHDPTLDKTGTRIKTRKTTRQEQTVAGPLPR